MKVISNIRKSQGEEGKDLGCKKEGKIGNKDELMSKRKESHLKVPICTTLDLEPTLETKKVL